jgi:uncharacterized protein (TIGR03437 family)
VIAGPRQFSTRYFDLGAGGIVRAIAFDRAGNLFVVSTSPAPDLPSILVTKTDSAGNVTATFRFGGSGEDIPAVIAVDPNGDLVIGGATASTDFPLVSPLQSSGSGFLTKLDPQLQTIRYSTRLGTPAINGLLNGVDAIAFDAAANVYVTGTAGSGMPVTSGTFQAQAPVPGRRAIVSYGFIAGIAAAGDRLIFSTYYTGTKTGSVGVTGAAVGAVFISTASTAIALDANGDVIIAGYTDVSDLPVTPGAYAEQCGCQFQQSTGFVAKLAKDGTKLIWGTYLPLTDASGYKGADLFAFGITRMVLDAAGNIVVAGHTLKGFPVTPHALQPTYPSTDASKLGAQAGFLAKFDPSGSKLIYSTYFGGSASGPFFGQTGLGGLTLDSQGTIWVTGGSDPAALPIQPATVLGQNYLAAISADGTSITGLYSAPAGASSTAIAITAQGTIAALGYPNSMLIGRPSDGPSVMGIAGSAAFRVSPFVAPRELVSIYGIGIGPASALPAQITDGVIANSLGGIQVLFGGAPAALLYAGPSQINAIVPTGVAAHSRTAVQIVTASGTIDGPTLLVQPALPEVFTDVAGRAIAMNQDGTLNSASNPAPLGSIVSVFATGTGDVIGGRPDNRINASLNQNPVPISVFSFLDALGESGHQSLEVLYDGDAPQAPSGVSQVNFRLPAFARLPVTNMLQLQIGVGAALSDTFSIYIK